MKQLAYLSLLALLPFLFSSCSASRQANQLKGHNDLLSKMANGNASPEEKLDAVMSSFTSMMSQGLKIVNPKKGGEYVTKYGKQNQAAINKILEDVGNWQKGLGPIQKATLGVRMLQKPYAKDAIDLIPQFQRKFNQIKLIGQLTKGVQSKLFNFGLGKLK